MLEAYTSALHATFAPNSFSRTMRQGRKTLVPKGRNRPEHSGNLVIGKWFGFFGHTPHKEVDHIGSVGQLCLNLAHKFATHEDVAREEYLLLDVLLIAFLHHNLLGGDDYLLDIAFEFTILRASCWP